MLQFTDDLENVDPNKIVTARTCVIGQAGSGKSYAVAVICEELAKNHLGFCIIDTEGEYFSLKDKYTILWAGTDPNADIDISTVELDKLALRCLTEGFPLILDVSESDNPREIVSKFCGAIYKHGSSLKKPYLVIVEEVDKFVPQTGEKVKELDEIARRGRKRGIGLMIATQRPAFVNKNILSQCSVQIIGRLTIPNDMSAVRFFFSNKKNLDKLSTLQAGEFFLLGDIPNNRLVKIRKRETVHKAVTPRIHEKKENKLEIENFKNLLSGAEESSQELTEVSTNVIPARTSSSNAMDIVLKKSSRLFLIKPQLLDSKLILRPLHLLRLREARKQVFGQTFVEMKICVDSISGNALRLDKGYKSLVNFNAFLELSSQEIELFKILKKPVSVSELCARTGYTENVVRTSLSKLQEKKIVSNKKSGRTNLYFKFTKAKLPVLKKISTILPSPEKLKLKAEIKEQKIQRKELEHFFKALGAIVVDYKLVHYPVYAVSYLKSRKKQVMYIDALNGKQLKF